MQMTAYYTTDFIGAAKLYPLIVHIPVILFIKLYLKKTLPVAVISVMTSYLCCKTPRWLAIIALHFWESEDAYLIGNSLGILAAFYLIMKYAAPSVNRAMSYSKHTLYLFGSLPILFYFFDYATTVYSDFLFSGSRIVIEILPSVLSMFYIIFVMVYYNEMQKRNRLELDNAML